MTESALSLRPLCAEVSEARGESLAATASRVEHWLLVEYGGYWPYDPLDASIFAGRLRAHLAEQLERLPHSRLLLVKQPPQGRRDRVRVVYGATADRGSRFRALELESHPDLLDIDFAAALRGETPPLGEPLRHPLLLVCTHGKRDRCCARYGQALCEALHAGTSAAWVWQSSHVGGDRFAGNLVCLPEGVYFGRVAPGHVEALLSAYRTGRIDLDRYRGRSCHAFPVQAAELHVRRETGLAGFFDLRLVAARRDGADAWRVELLAELAGVVHEVRVELRVAEEEFLTCRATTPKRARRYVATAHDVRAADSEGPRELTGDVGR